MLRDNDAMATIAVREVDVARDFYGGKLGLNELPSENSGVLIYQSGHSKLQVYRSEYAGTNRATAATWIVSEDLKAIVETLKSKGVTFEHYDLPALTLQDDIYVGDGFSVVWFKDPDSNILSVIQPAG